MAEIEPIASHSKLRARKLYQEGCQNVPTYGYLNHLPKYDCNLLDLIFLHFFPII